jgi:hypothetical protein
MSYLQVINYPPVPLTDDLDFDVSWNYIQAKPGELLPFVHVEVFYWRASVLRKLMALWPSVRAGLPNIIFCSGTESDVKFQKFIAHFGWQPLQLAHCSDGKDRMIYVHYAQAVPGNL